MPQLGFLSEAQRFQGQILKLLGEHARDRAQRACPSRTLRRSMVVLVDPVTGEAAVHVPHYWAVYYHNGRGPVRPRVKRFICFFKNPKLDPRTDGTKNYPVRATHIRRLTKAQFQAGRANGTLIVVRSTKAAVGVPFFDRGLKSFPFTASAIVPPEFDRFVRSLVAGQSETAEVECKI